MVLFLLFLTTSPPYVSTRRTPAVAGVGFEDISSSVSDDEGNTRYQEDTPEDDGSMGLDLEAEFAQVLARIHAAQVIHEPFPHIDIKGFFSDRLYAALMQTLPDRSKFGRGPYAGTASRYRGIMVDKDVEGRVNVPKDCCESKEDGCKCWHQWFQLHENEYQTGYRLTDFRLASKLWVEVAKFSHSCHFMTALVKKLMLPGGAGIPQWKRGRIREDKLRNSAALRIQGEPYHLTPHVDLPAKLVTWQMFIPRTDELDDKGFGTFFYSTKRNIAIDDRAGPAWLAYENFDYRIELPAFSNHFFAFAPNTFSFHGANITKGMLDSISDPDERRTFLGFVTLTDDHFHHFKEDDWVPPPDTPKCEDRTPYEG